MHSIWSPFNLEYSLAEWLWCLTWNLDILSLKSRSDQYLDLFHVVSGSTPRLRLYKVNCPSCQLKFLTCLVRLLCSIAICIVGPHQPVFANYDATHQIKSITINKFKPSSNSLTYYCSSSQLKHEPRIAWYLLAQRQCIQSHTLLKKVWDICVCLS